MFEEIETAKGANKIQQYFNKVYRELSLHAHGEELVFYPFMREYDETAKYVEEAEEEHNSVKILLEEMKSLQRTDDEFKTKLEY